MSLPPGPRTPGALALLQWMANPIGTFEKGFREYGDVYSAKNPFYGTEVILAHPELIKQVFTGSPELFHGGEANLPLSPIVGTSSVLVLDGREHHRQRKLLLPPFHGERLAVYADVMRDVTARVVDAWPVGQRVSILPSMQRITFDVILETVFGMREGEEIEALRSRMLSVVETAQSPLGMLRLLPAFQNALTGYASFKRRVAEADEVLYGIIARARAALPDEGPANAESRPTLGEGTRRLDVLSLLLSAVDEEGHPMSDGELRDELFTLLLAGYETTATALAWAVEEILRRPDVLAHLLDELRAVPASEVQRADLPYLDATIKEVLRVRPVSTLLPRRITAPITLRAYEIPAGTYVLPCVYLAHHHPDCWEAPHEFRPERFLDKKPDPYAWIPFGGGARRCIGMAFALFEMRVVLATLFSRLRLSAWGPPAKLTLRSFFFAPKGGTRVVVEERLDA